MYGKNKQILQKMKDIFCFCHNFKNLVHLPFYKTNEICICSIIELFINFIICR